MSYTKVLFSLGLMWCFGDAGILPTSSLDSYDCRWHFRANTWKILSLINTPSGAPYHHCCCIYLNILITFYETKLKWSCVRSIDTRFKRFKRRSLSIHSILSSIKYYSSMEHQDMALLEVLMLTWVSEEEVKNTSPELHCRPEIRIRSIS